MKGRALSVLTLIVVLGACSAKSRPAIAATVTERVTTTVSTTVTNTISPSATGRASAQTPPESCGNLVQGSDGDFGPPLCPDGHPNVLEIAEWRDMNYLTIDLDPPATAKQVHAALCVDLAAQHPTQLMLSTLYQTASALNHWDFPNAPIGSDGSISC